MSKLSPVPRRILIEKLRGLGFSGPHPATNHEYMQRGNQKIFVPNPHGKDIGVPLIKRIISQIGIDNETFTKL